MATSGLGNTMMQMTTARPRKQSLMVQSNAGLFKAGGPLGGGLAHHSPLGALGGAHGGVAGSPGAGGHAGAGAPPHALSLEERNPSSSQRKIAPPQHGVSPASGHGQSGVRKTSTDRREPNSGHGSSPEFGAARHHPPGQVASPKKQHHAKHDRDHHDHHHACSDHSGGPSHGYGAHHGQRHVERYASDGTSGNPNAAGAVRHVKSKDRSAMKSKSKDKPAFGSEDVLHGQAANVGNAFTIGQGNSSPMAGLHQGHVGHGHAGHGHEGHGGQGHNHRKTNSGVNAGVSVFSGAVKRGSGSKERRGSFGILLNSVEQTKEARRKSLDSSNSSRNFGKINSNETASTPTRRRNSNSKEDVPRTPDPASAPAALQNGFKQGSPGGQGGASSEDSGFGNITSPDPMTPSSAYPSAYPGSPVHGDYGVAGEDGADHGGMGGMGGKQGDDPDGYYGSEGYETDGYLGDSSTPQMKKAGTMDFITSSYGFQETASRVQHVVEAYGPFLQRFYIFFIIIIIAFGAGIASAGLHMLVTMLGCPLGINSCSHSATVWLYEEANLAYVSFFLNILHPNENLSARGRIRHDEVYTGEMVEYNFHPSIPDQDYMSARCYYEYSYGQSYKKYFDYYNNMALTFDATRYGKSHARNLHARDHARDHASDAGNHASDTRNHASDARNHAGGEWSTARDHAGEWSPVGSIIGPWSGLVDYEAKQTSLLERLDPDDPLAPTSFIVDPVLAEQRRLEQLKKDTPQKYEKLQVIDNRKCHKYHQYGSAPYHCNVEIERRLAEDRKRLEREGRNANIIADEDRFDFSGFSDVRKLRDRNHDEMTGLMKPPTTLWDGIFGEFDKFFLWLGQRIVVFIGLLDESRTSTDNEAGADANSINAVRTTEDPPDVSIPEWYNNPSGSPSSSEWDSEWNPYTRPKRKLSDEPETPRVSYPTDLGHTSSALYKKVLKPVVPNAVAATCDLLDDGKNVGRFFEITMLFIVFNFLVIFSLAHFNTRYDISGGGTKFALIATATGTRIPLQKAIVRVICSCIYVGAGNTLGMEAPTIYFCTSISQNLGYLFNMATPDVQSVLASIGAACGLAVAFNTPVAGIVYALEELGTFTPFSMSKPMAALVSLSTVFAVYLVRSFIKPKLPVTYVYNSAEDEIYSPDFPPEWWLILAFTMSVSITVFCVHVSKAMVFLRWFWFFREEELLVLKEQQDLLNNAEGLLAKDEDDSGSRSGRRGSIGGRSKTSRFSKVADRDAALSQVNSSLNSRISVNSQTGHLSTLRLSSDKDLRDSTSSSKSHSSGSGGIPHTNLGAVMSPSAKLTELTTLSDDDKLAQQANNNIFELARNASLPGQIDDSPRHNIPRSSEQPQRGMSIKQTMSGAFRAGNYGGEMVGDSPVTKILRKNPTHKHALSSQNEDPFARKSQQGKFVAKSGGVFTGGVLTSFMSAAKNTIKGADSRSSVPEANTVGAHTGVHTDGGVHICHSQNALTAHGPLTMPTRPSNGTMRTSRKDTGDKHDHKHHNGDGKHGDHEHGDKRQHHGHDKHDGHEDHDSHGAPRQSGRSSSGKAAREDRKKTADSSSASGNIFGSAGLLREMNSSPAARDPKLSGGLRGSWRKQSFAIGMGSRSQSLSKALFKGNLFDRQGSQGLEGRPQGPANSKQNIHKQSTARRDTKQHRGSEKAGPLINTIMDGELAGLTGNSPTNSAKKAPGSYSVQKRSAANSVDRVDSSDAVSASPSYSPHHAAHSSDGKATPSSQGTESQGLAKVKKKKSVDGITGPGGNPAVESAGGSHGDRGSHGERGSRLHSEKSKEHVVHEIKQKMSNEMPITRKVSNDRVSDTSKRKLSDPKTGRKASNPRISDSSSPSLLHRKTSNVSDVTSLLPTAASPTVLRAGSSTSVGDREKRNSGNRVSVGFGFKKGMMNNLLQDDDLAVPKLLDDHSSPHNGHGHNPHYGHGHGPIPGGRGESKQIIRSNPEHRGSTRGSLKIPMGQFSDGSNESHGQKHGQHLLREHSLREEQALGLSAQGHGAVRRSFSADTDGHQDIPVVDKRDRDHIPGAMDLPVFVPPCSSRSMNTKPMKSLSVGGGNDGEFVSSNRSMMGSSANELARSLSYTGSYDDDLVDGGGSYNYPQAPPTPAPPNQFLVRKRKKQIWLWCGSGLLVSVLSFICLIISNGKEHIWGAHSGAVIIIRNYTPTLFFVLLVAKTSAVLLSVSIDAPAGSLVPTLQIGVYAGGWIGSILDSMWYQDGKKSPNTLQYYYETYGHYGPKSSWYYYSRNQETHGYHEQFNDGGTFATNPTLSYVNPTHLELINIHASEEHYDTIGNPLFVVRCCAIGMVAGFVAIFRFPLTSVVMFIEISQDLTIFLDKGNIFLIAIVFTAFTSQVVASCYTHDSFIEQFLQQDNIDLSGAWEEINMLQSQLEQLEESSYEEEEDDLLDYYAGDGIVEGDWINDSMAYPSGTALENINEDESEEGEDEY